MNKVKKIDYEVSTIQAMIFAITTFYSFIAIDVYTENDRELYLIILSISVVVFVIGFFINYISKLFLLFLCLYLFVSLILSTWFFLFEYGHYLFPQMIVLALYLISISLFFWKILQSTCELKQFDGTELNSTIGHKIKADSRKRRKLRRRNNSKKVLGTSIKSGKYRGWWTGF
jgi:hypothetical protein